MYGMKVERVEEGRDEIRVATTGAIYTINKASGEGEILCEQRIGKERLVTTLKVHRPLSALTVEETNDEVCIIHQSTPPTECWRGLRIRIHADSMMSIVGDKPIKATFTGSLIPEYGVVERGNFILIDGEGGIGCYPLGWEPPKTSLRFSGRDWQVSLLLGGGQRFLTSVFPPRTFNWEKSFRDRIVHHFAMGKPYPMDEEVRDWSQYGNILVLHATVWKGKYTRVGRELKGTVDAYADSSYTSYRYTPKDPEELKRVVDAAHDAGMRVIPYMSPCYSLAEEEEFVREVGRVVRDYNMDGVYFDGVSDGVGQAYRIMRGVRGLLGDRVLYVHVPSPIIGESYGDGYYVYCPFIDAYADYTLRAEHVKNFDWRYLRYTISTYNISNSIGFVCNYDYPPEFVRKIIDQVLAANARLPYWVGRWVSGEFLKEERPKDLKIEEELQQVMREEYFPKLHETEKRINL